MLRGRRGAALVMAVGLVAVAAAPPSLAAKGRKFEIPPGRNAHLSVAGTHGYRITIERSRGHVSLTARKGPGSATYFAPGDSGHDDSIHARFPGVGRVSVRFQASGKPKKLESLCSGPKSIRQAGRFIGTIAFDGEQGFTRVAATHAHGYVEQTFRAICREPNGLPGQTPDLPSLQTWSSSPGRGMGLDVIEFPKPAAAPAPIPALTVFSANTVEARQGMTIFRSVNVSARATSFTVEGPPDRPESATLSPPKPFHGTATFHAAPGGPGEWDGTISVELPGAGPVEVARPPSESELCRGKRCVGNGSSSNGTGAFVVVTSPHRHP